LQTQQGLGHVVTAGAELVQHLAVRDQSRHLEGIERTRNENGSQNAPPVD
jgi:hypothetical protein